MSMNATGERLAADLQIDYRERKWLLLAVFCKYADGASDSQP